MVSYILITGYRLQHSVIYELIEFSCIILKVLVVNLLAALNFANVFFKTKKRLENKKR